MTTRVQGSVTSGFGKGKEFVKLEGYARQFEEQLGYTPYPGTLNLDLDTQIDDLLEQLQPICIDGWENDQSSFGAVNCYPASVPEGDSPVPLHVIVPDRTDHDTSTVELVSPKHLRDQFGLSDGSELEITIQSAHADS